MTGFTVNITGIAQAQKELNKYVSRKTKELVDETNKAALKVERGAKRRAPVDTGRLRSSIHAVPTNSVDEETGVRTGKEDSAVVTNVVYAPFQEFINPYLFPAWENERKEYIENVKRILRKL